MAYNLNNLYPRPAGTDQRLTVDSTTGGVSFTAFTATAQDAVMFDVQTVDVFATIDGSAPTTSNGHRLYAGTFYTWSVGMANAAKFISSSTATSAAVHASPIGV